MDNQRGDKPELTAGQITKSKITITLALIWLVIFGHTMFAIIFPWLNVFYILNHSNCGWFLSCEASAFIVSYFVLIFGSIIYNIAYFTTYKSLRKQANPLTYRFCTLISALAIISILLIVMSYGV